MEAMKAQDPEQDRRLQEMHMDAIKEIVRERSKNGLTTDEESLLLAVKIHVEHQINQAMLEGFYKGTFLLGERDGEIWIANASEQNIQEAKQWRNVSNGTPKENQ